MTNQTAFIFHNFKNYFLKSELSKNTTVLVLSTIVAQAIPLLLHPVLRRMFTPENFGAYAVYLNIIGIIVIMSSLRYDASIVLPKNDIESSNILVLSLIISFVTCSFILIMILFFKSRICEWINFPVKYSHYLYVLPFSAMFFSFYLAINNWLIRRKNFRASAINKISRRGMEGGTQAIAGFGGFSSGLVLGDLLGNVANVISGIFQTHKGGFSLSYISIKKIIFVSKKYKDFPLYNLFPTLLSSAATLLPFIFINKLYSSEDVGYIDLSRLVLSIPIALISVTLSQVIFQHVTSKKNNNQSISKDLIGILYFLLTIAALEIITVNLWAPDFFGFVFGSGYSLSGVYAKILVYSFTLNFIITTYSSVFISLNKIKLLSIWQVLYFGLICCLLFFQDIELVNFLKIFVSIEVGMSLIYCFLLYKMVKQYESEIQPN